MSFVEILLLSLSLSLDSCAVALASSAAGRIADRRSALRLSFHFGLFQFLMPLVGWVAGTQIEPFIASFDHWIAFGLLAFVALRMIQSARKSSPIDESPDPTRGWVLVTLATATSLDALAVGIGLAALRISAWYPSALIGLITMFMSVTAIYGGMKVGRWVGAKAQLAGGVILLFIGLKIIIVHVG